MVVKLDEDLSPLNLPLFRQFGYDARTVVQQGLQGSSDEALWRRIQEDGEMLVTADKGFGDIRAFPPGSHAGIILLRAEDPRIPVYERVLSTLLSKHRLDDLSGFVVVVTETLIRIRR